MLDDVREEIEGLHVFLVDWFGGAIERDAGVFRRRFLERCDDDFLLVQPGGVSVHIRDFAPGLEQAYGTNASFRIAVRDVKVRRNEGGLVLATYEEWQRNAKSSTPPENGRVSSVWLRREANRLRWLHVHETWLPADVMAKGPYDF